MNAYAADVEAPGRLRPRSPPASHVGQHASRVFGRARRCVQLPRMVRFDDLHVGEMRGGLARKALQQQHAQSEVRRDEDGPVRLARGGVDRLQILGREAGRPDHPVGSPRDDRQGVGQGSGRLGEIDDDVGSLLTDDGEEIVVLLRLADELDPVDLTQPRHERPPHAALGSAEHDTDVGHGHSLSFARSASARCAPYASTSEAWSRVSTDPGRTRRTSRTASDGFRPRATR